jgi:two-component system, sensor histidine kinase and response regulator
MTRKILVVDDNAIIRHSTALLVNGFGFASDEAASGHEALTHLEAGQYALIFLDYNMPEMDGFQCTAQIREREKGTGKRIPIICLSACSEQEIKDACLDVGMDDYLDKACTNEEFEAMILKWVAVTT